MSPEGQNASEEEVDPQTAPVPEDSEAPMFQATEVVELSKRQQNLARQIVLNMESKGPYGITAGRWKGMAFSGKCCRCSGNCRWPRLQSMTVSAY